jgi:hypothetical protein
MTFEQSLGELGRELPEAGVPKCQRDDAGGPASGTSPAIDTALAAILAFCLEPVCLDARSAPDQPAAERSAIEGGLDDAPNSVCDFGSAITAVIGLTFWP